MDETLLTVGQAEGKDALENSRLEGRLVNEIPACRRLQVKDVSTIHQKKRINHLPRGQIVKWKGNYPPPIGNITCTDDAEESSDFSGLAETSLPVRNGGTENAVPYKKKKNCKKKKSVKSQTLSSSKRAILKESEKWDKFENRQWWGQSQQVVKPA